MLSQKIIITTIIIALLSTGGFIAAEFYIQQKAQSEINQAGISVLQLWILDFDDNSITMNITYKITNPSGTEASYDSFPLQLHYYGKIIGIATASSGSIKGTENIVTEEIKVVVQNNAREEFKEFIKDFIMLPQISFQIKGELTLHAKAGIFEVKTTAMLEKTINLNGANGYRDIKIENLNLDKTTNTTLVLTSDVSITNPTNVSVELIDMEFDFKYNSYVIGTLSIPQFQLKPGVNREKVTIEVSPENETIAAEMVTNYLNNIDMTLTIHANFNINKTSILTDAITDLSFNVTLSSQGILSVDVPSILINNLSNTEISGEATVTITNPTNLEGNITQLYFDVFYEQQLLGTVGLENFYLSKGVNTYNLDYVLVPENNTVLQTLATNYLTNHSVELLLKGSAEHNTLSRLLQGWEKTITLTPAGLFEIKINAIGLLSATNETIDVYVSVGFYNPSQITLKITNLTLALTWLEHKDKGKIGTITIPELVASNGWNNITLNSTLKPDSSQLLALLIATYLQNNETITIQATKVSTEQPTIIDPIIQSLNLTFSLPASEPLTLVVNNMRILNATNSVLTLNTTITITNPSAVPVTLDMLNFTVEYGEYTLGEISITNMTIYPDTHQYVLVLPFQVQNNTLLEEVITEYVNGNNLTFSVSAKSQGNNILSKVIKDYFSNVTIPGFRINPNIYDLAIVNTTETTLEINATISLENPTNMNVSIASGIFNLYYQGVFIGNLTIPDNTVLNPGTNLVTVTGIITSEDNITAVEDFLSKYVGGETTYLNVQGNIASNFSGLIPETTVLINLSLPITGIQSDLVSSITITSIVINLSGPSVDITAVAKIHNPFNFNITVESISYELYFDDPDGATYLLVSYPPKNHIYMGTLEDTEQFNMTGSSYYNKTILYRITTLELTVRLNDEYGKGQLKVDVVNGILSVKIGAFRIKINFNFNDLPVE